jgi:hypothetical protein
MTGMTMVLCVALLASVRPTVAAELDKKLIEHGWDMPYPTFIRDHVREMEKRPFDGVVLKLEGGRNVFEPTRWAEADFAADFEALGEVKWKRFTDNFIAIGAATTQDWFNDEHWQAIEHNAHLVARAARVGGCVGLCLDPKAYKGVNPWSYADAAHHDTKSFDEYQSLVRRRGAQFMRAVEQELPGAKVMTLWMLSGLARFLVYWDPDGLADQKFGLLPSFFNGMLHAAGPNVTIMDGNMHSYWNEDRSAYLLQYHRLKQRSLLLVDPANIRKFQTQVQVSMAAYADTCYGRYKADELSAYMTPEEQATWFEHNVYWALYTADEYAWCRSEKMNWWTGKDLPDSAEAAVRSARHKIATAPWPGIDMGPIFEAARQRQQQARAKQHGDGR